MPKAAIDMPRMITTQNRSIVETRGIRFADATFAGAVNRIVIIRGMKRFFTISLIALALLVGAAGAAPAARAAVCGDASTLNQSCTTSSGGNGLCIEDSTSGGIYCSALATTNRGVDPNAVDPAAAKTPLAVPPSPDLGDGFSKVMTWIMSLFAWLVGVAAITLDYAVYFTVVTMGDYVNKLSAVGVTWQIMRDIGNIVIIFGFLAAGIATIINVDMYGWGKKMLPMLLVAAVFINFSLFITEAVIDTGNLFATQFYTQIKGGQMPSSATLSQTTIENEGISNKIMGQLGLQTIYTAGRVNTEVFKAGNTWVVGFMAIILFLITAFVMFSLAFILIARFVILLFLIIVAPIGFAGLAVPKLENTAKKWWGALFEQTITAPVLLLCLYIALAIITDASFLTGICTGSGGSAGCTKNWAGFVQGNDLTGFASMMLSFLIAMGLLLAVVIISKKMSAFGADKASALAGKLTFGATAWGMRTSGGWLAHKTSRGLRKIGVGSVPLVGTGLVRGLDKIASGSFDVRGVAMGGGLKTLGIDAGTAQKGGYKADLKSRVESRTKYADELIGFELSPEKKAEQAALQNEIKRLQKARGQATTVAAVQGFERQIKTAEENLAKVESWTDKGQQRRYARALNLWTDEKNFFNKYINFATNTDAAKIIREKAKKSKPDKDWSANMKKLLEEAEESSGATGAGSRPTTPSPSASAPATPPPGPTAAPSGGTPPAS